MTLAFRNISSAIFTFLLLVLSHQLMAQLQRYPAFPSRNAPVSKGESSVGRTKEVAPLTLPFFDDFSKPFKLAYADTGLWENSSSVWINDGMAIQPPTLYVATFDGLNSSGTPYNPNEVLLTGYTDTLMSRPIDLSDAKVSIAERSSVFLSFYYQWKGNLEPPDKKDFLEVAFKTAEEGGWETVMTIFPKEEADATVFYDTIIQVSGDQFFHDQFQFRIRSFGRLSGPFDSWHVDYVYLNKGRTIDDLSFPDRAIATQLGPLFGKYRAMPRRHFRSNNQMTHPSFEVQNMKDAPSSVNYHTEAYFSSTDRRLGVTSPSHTAVLSESSPSNGTNGVLLEKEHRLATLDTVPDINDPLQFPQDAGIDSTIIRLTVALQTNDNIPFNYFPPIEPDSTGDYTKNYIPIKFTVNDTLTADYILSDYYAYDDGVAEYSAGLIEAGNLVAYEFELDVENGVTQDTLVGFDVYFPPYAVTTSQRVDFFIYHEDTDPAKAGLPGAQWLRIASRPVLKKGPNEFQRIEFLPALLIDERKFYIGWQAPAGAKVMVGLDMSNDTGDKISVNTNGVWYRNEDVTGSLMLRPVFGSGVIDASVGIEEEELVGVFPNPNRGHFYIDGDARNLQIFSMTGENIAFRSSDAGNGRTEVSMSAYHPGVYILRYRSGNFIRSRKLIVTR